jgi:hypothetical protein
VYTIAEIFIFALLPILLGIALLFATVGRQVYDNFRNLFDLLEERYDQYLNNREGDIEERRQLRQHLRDGREHMDGERVNSQRLRQLETTLINTLDSINSSIEIGSQNVTATLNRVEATIRELEQRVENLATRVEVVQATNDNLTRLQHERNRFEDQLRQSRGSERRLQQTVYEYNQNSIRDHEDHIRRYPASQRRAQAGAPLTSEQQERVVLGTLIDDRRNSVSPPDSRAPSPRILWGDGAPIPEVRAETPGINLSGYTTEVIDTEFVYNLRIGDSSSSDRVSDRPNDDARPRLLARRSRRIRVPRE